MYIYVFGESKVIQKTHSFVLRAFSMHIPFGLFIHCSYHAILSKLTTFANPNYSLTLFQALTLKFILEILP